MIVELLFSHLAVFVLAYFFFRKKVKKMDETGAQDVRQMREHLAENEKMAQAAEDRIWATLESMAEGVLITDAEGKIVLLNSALSHKLGTVKIPDNIHFWEGIRDQEVNLMIETCLREKKSQLREHSILLSGSVFEIQVSPVWSARTFMGVVAVFHDVTRLKELERVRTEFVANVSHELKTPLTSILGYAETLKEGAIDDKEHRDEFLSVIENHARRLHALIEELLLLSSVESDGVPIALEKTDLKNLVERTLGLFKIPLAQKKIHLDKKFPEGPLEVQADPELLERALSNLIDNAIKYSHSGGSIRIEGRLNQGTVELSVQDWGLGIAESDLPRIFERFYRADKSRARESGGTGLGLAIAKHIIERHGGYVRAESAHGKGSVFTMVLPAQESELN